MEIPESMMADKITHATIEYDNLSVLLTYVIHGLPLTKAEVINQVQPFWDLRDEVGAINGIAIKSRIIVILVYLQN